MVHGLPEKRLGISCKRTLCSSKVSVLAQNSTVTIVSSTWWDCSTGWARYISNG